MMAGSPTPKRARAVRESSAVPKETLAQLVAAKRSKQLELLKWPSDVWATWFASPRLSLIQTTNFVVSKSPMSTLYEMDLKHVFSVDMLVERIQEDGHRIALSVNATSDANLFLYANKDVYEEWDIDTTDMPIEDNQIDGGLDPALYRFVAPSRDQVKLFIAKVQDVLSEDALVMIHVASAFGYNRSGTLICSFLIEHGKKTLKEALNVFAQSRPPGIYSKSCLLALQRRYGQSIPVQAPAAPAWDLKSVELGASYSVETTMKPLVVVEPRSVVAELIKPWIKGWSNREKREFFFNPETKKSVWKIEDCK